MGPNYVNNPLEMTAWEIVLTRLQKKPCITKIFALNSLQQPRPKVNTVRGDSHTLRIVLTCTDFPREAGLDINDVTSYLAAQKTWNVDDRAHRPKILFQWAKTGHRNPTYVVSDWYYEGKIVLDLKNCPVRKFCNIPETCSSALEGGIMEAIEREDSRIG